MEMRPGYITAREAARRGADQYPKEAMPASSLVYSSPATLSYNSPGANGFGVKRAGLVMPESVMLLVSPGCCGRNSTILSRESGYADRMFYLNMDETDLVMSRHLKKIPQAIEEILEVPEKRPKVVLVCLTCVDALLGTDLAGICRKAEEQCGVYVIPCYMYALTREGTKPPMALIRDTLYSRLKRLPVNPHAVNLLGNFAPLRDDSELYPMFRRAGITKIREIARCGTMDEYLEMGEANFNLVLNPEADYAAEQLMNRLNMPYIEMTRFYRTDRIAKQYELFGAAAGVKLDDREYREEAEDRLESFLGKHRGDLTFALGSMMNANPFELASSLLHYGFRVSEIFASYTKMDLPFVREIAAASPDTRIYFGTAPSMMHYHAGAGADAAIGRDTKWYEPDAVPVQFSSDVQPFGYRGLISFLDEMETALQGNGK
ncbi:MAG: nitrogenase component 1 [Bilifractor sp.]|jgi:nitrogenase molybdenum-cofactor synthesis protein NifE